MKPSRKIAHIIADLVLKSANNSLDAKRMKNLYSKSASISGDDGMVINSSNGDHLLDIWTDSIVEHISSRKDRIISDYILDVIENSQTHLKLNYSEDELNEMAILLSTPLLNKLFSDESLLKIAFDLRDCFNQNIVKEMQSEECVSIMQKKLHRMIDVNDSDDI